MCSIPTKHFLSRLSFRRTKTRDLTPTPVSAKAQNVLQYEPFTHDDEIRLIILYPGGFDQLIRCELVHVRLDEKPAYDALSYVWGKEQDTDDVIVNRCSHRVGRNLYLALKHLRLEGQERRIWIDALCINQKNDSERGYQVAQMGVIYSHAAIVRIWLGLSNQFTEATFAIINQIHRTKQHALHFDNDTRNHFISLCSRPYWDRLWIIQEVVLASEIEIHCGLLGISWESFSSISHENPEALDEIRHSGASSLCRQRLLVKGKSPVQEARFSLLSLMQVHIQAQCADVRDKIYGLHSFAPECCRQAVPVDYSCSAYELCGRLLVHEILQHTPKPETFMDTAHQLQHLFVGGCVEQHSSQMAFDAGTWEASVSKLSHRAITTQVSVSRYGKVVWTSPPLSEIWSNGQDLKVPVDLINLIGAEHYLDNYSMEKLASAQRHTKILSATTIRQMSSEQDFVQKVPLPKSGQPAKETDFSDYAMVTLRNFLLSAQAHLSTDMECYLSLVESEKGDRYFMHSQIHTQINDELYEFGRGRRGILAFVEEDTHKILGTVASFQPTLPTTSVDVQAHFNVSIPIILALSEAAFSRQRTHNGANVILDTATYLYNQDTAPAVIQPHRTLSKDGFSLAFAEEPSHAT